MGGAFVMNKIYRSVHREVVSQVTLTKSILLALSLGISVFAAPMVSFALPQVGAGGSGTAVIKNSSGSQMDITSPAKNNVINWRSFDIAKPETVQFDQGEKTNNYLNLIQDNKASLIDGTLKGGNNIYLINPNGVIFGADSVVNVGSLYVSTRQLDDAAVMAFANNGTNPLSSASGGANGDIVNLGKTVADSVLLEGQNITFTNKITSLNGSQPVVDIKAGSEVKIGLVDNQFNNGNPAQGLDTEKQQFMHLNDELGNFKNRAQISGIEGATPYYLVRNVYELQNMRNNIGGNYMLAGDIDASNSTSKIDNIGIPSEERIHGTEFVGGLSGEVGGSNTVIGYNPGDRYSVTPIGGLIGEAHGSGSIIGYNIETVKAVDNIGGLVGKLDIPGNIVLYIPGHVGIYLPSKGPVSNDLSLQAANSLDTLNSLNSNMATQVSALKLWTTGDSLYVNDSLHLAELGDARAVLLYDSNTLQPLSKSLQQNGAE